MKDDTYEELQNMLRELCRQRENLQVRIDENNLSIQEVQCFTKKIFDKEDEDFKVFSPRKIEDIYREELEQYSARKDSLERQNIELTAKRDKLDSIIRLLRMIEETDSPLESRDSDIREEKSALIQMQEKDRQRIAGDLQDSVLQTLTHLSHKIELSSKFIGQDPVRAKQELAVVSKDMKKVIEDIRGAIFDLSPMNFDDMGLKEVFENLLSRFNNEHCYEMDVRLEDVSCENNMTLMILYRVVQECLNNIHKHANAQKVLFSCKQEDGKCILLIEDDGNGFVQEEVNSNQEKYFGMLSIKEYVTYLGGEFQIDSELNKGTKIRIEVPL